MILMELTVNSIAESVYLIKITHHQIVGKYNLVCNNNKKYINLLLINLSYFF